MKWDIDKAIEAIEDDPLPGTIVQRVFFSDVTALKRVGIHPTAAEREKQSAVMWSISFGRLGRPKFTFYGRTVRAAYLQARKQIKKFTPEDRRCFAVRVPKKSNSYLSARKYRDGKKKK